MVNIAYKYFNVDIVKLLSAVPNHVGYSAILAHTSSNPFPSDSFRQRKRHPNLWSALPKKYERNMYVGVIY